MKRITIKDIAKEFGVHHSTVSRALRGSSDINAATRSAIVQYAREKGYQINRNALHLRGAGSNIIGVVVPNIHHSFFSNFVSVFTRLAFAKGFIVSVFQSEESVGQEREIVAAIIQQNLAGVIASLSMESTDVAHFEKLKRFGIPLVGFDRIHPSLSIPTVVLDNEAALNEVVLQLYDRGFSRIAYFSGLASIELFKERQRGYFKGLKRIRSDYEECICVAEGFSVEQGFEKTRALFQKKDVPDALIFDSHLLAWGAMSFLSSYRPELLTKTGIASFGLYPWMTASQPNVLSIQQPEEAMAEASFELINEAITKTSFEAAKSLKFKANLI